MRIHVIMDKLLTSIIRLKILTHGFEVSLKGPYGTPGGTQWERKKTPAKLEFHLLENKTEKNRKTL